MRTFYRIKHLLYAQLCEHSLTFSSFDDTETRVRRRTCHLIRFQGGGSILGRIPRRGAPLEVVADQLSLVGVNPWAVTNLKLDYQFRVLNINGECNLE